MLIKLSKYFLNDFLGVKRHSESQEGAPGGRMNHCLILNYHMIVPQIFPHIQG